LRLNVKHTFLCPRIIGHEAAGNLSAAIIPSPAMNEMGRAIFFKIIFAVPFLSRTFAM
jgi:hypothetical protein